MTNNDDRIKDIEKAIQSLHIRISKNSEFTMREWRLVAEEIKDLFTVHKEKIGDDCREHLERTAKLETSLSWLNRWLTAVSAALVSVGGWIFHHKMIK